MEAWIWYNEMKLWNEKKNPEMIHNVNVSDSISDFIVVMFIILILTANSSIRPKIYFTTLFSFEISHLEEIRQFKRPIDSDSPPEISFRIS